MNHEFGPAARCVAVGLEDIGGRVGVRLHDATAHPREVEQRGTGAHDSVEADGSVSGKWVAGGGLREGLEDGVRDCGGAGNGCGGEEEEVREAQRGSGEVLPPAAAAPCPWFWAWSWG